MAALLDVGACELELGHADTSIAASERALAVGDAPSARTTRCTAYASAVAVAWAAKEDVTRARALYRRAIDSFTR